MENEKYNYKYQKDWQSKQFRPEITICIDKYLPENFDEMSDEEQKEEINRVKAELKKKYEDKANEKGMSLNAYVKFLLEEEILKDKQESEGK